LPSAAILLKSLRRKEWDFEPKTIGDHIRKKRLQLGLTQKQVGKLLRVTDFSIINWERGDFQPDRPTILRRIIEFLGFDPDPPLPKTLADRLRAKRREMGWGQRKLAKHLGVDGSTITRWEQGLPIGIHAHRTAVARLLGLSENELDCDSRGAIAIQPSLRP
jgi:transcriptional regulator with XRE-family HTH domain